MRITRIVLLVTLLGCLLVGGRGLGLAAPAQSDDQPGVLLSGLQTPAGVRYSLTLANSMSDTLAGLHVDIALPDDAVFVDALETPGRTHFLGNAGGTLSWAATDFGRDSLIDSFTFVVKLQPAGAFGVHATWGGAQPGEISVQRQPSVATATATEADLTFDGGGLDFQPVGDTGLIAVQANGDIPAGTTVHIRTLGPDANPPAGTGDLWWCAMVEVTGLPDGASLLLMAPARQPLPPGAAIALFARGDGQWADTGVEGLVTADGQSLLFTHTGGVMAAGTGAGNQPLSSRVSSSASLTPGAVGINRAQATILASQNADLAALMVQPAQCPPGDCAGLQPCFNSELIAGHTCANGGVTAQGQSAQQTGRTHCQSGGVQCTGSVPFFPGMKPAPAGHGTACSFAGFTQPRVRPVCGPI